MENFSAPELDYHQTQYTQNYSTLEREVRQPQRTENPNARKPIYHHPGLYRNSPTP